MKFWWVNHKQTWKQEIEGGYLWSPKREAKARSQFYDNMRIAARGDKVVAYSRQKVSYIGVVSDDAISAPKPDEYRAAGEYWSTEGWRLPVHWTPIPTPFAPKSILNEIARLLPGKYSPLSQNGDGVQKAYFAEIRAELFEILCSKGKIEQSQLQGVPPVFDALEASLEDIVENAICAESGLSETEKQQLCLSRRGQGLFRDRVRAIEGRCRVTGVETPTLLIASHIKPWRLCNTAAERLDGNNGLMLTPTIDKLFDRGLVSFQDTGDLIISPRFMTIDQQRLGLLGSFNAKPFLPKQCEYLAYHRANILLP